MKEKNWAKKVREKYTNKKGGKNRTKQRERKKTKRQIKDRE